MLSLAIALITVALVLYSSGVWAEHRAGVLRPRHAALFAAGLVADASGTALMSRIASEGTYAASGLASALTTLMAVTGAAALILMLVHLGWALVVLWRGSDSAKRTFHRFSLGVWGLWLVPYVTGMAGAMIQ